MKKRPKTKKRPKAKTVQTAKKTAAQIQSATRCNTIHIVFSRTAAADLKQALINAKMQKKPALSGQLSTDQAAADQSRSAFRNIPDHCDNGLPVFQQKETERDQIVTLEGFFEYGSLDSDLQVSRKSALLQLFSDSPQAEEIAAESVDFLASQLGKLQALLDLAANNAASERAGGSMKSSAVQTAGQSDFPGEKPSVRICLYASMVPDEICGFFFAADFLQKYQSKIQTGLLKVDVFWLEAAKEHIRGWAQVRQDQWFQKCPAPVPLSWTQLQAAACVWNQLKPAELRIWKNDHLVQADPEHIRIGLEEFRPKPFCFCQTGPSDSNLLRNWYVKALHDNPWHLREQLIWHFLCQIRQKEAQQASFSIHLQD